MHSITYDGLKRYKGQSAFCIAYEHMTTNNIEAVAKTMSQQRTLTFLNQFFSIEIGVIANQE